jgi:acetyl esterase
MTLNAQARLLLDRVAEAGYPPLQAHAPEVARAIYAKTSGLLDARGVPIGGSEDRTFEGPGGPLRVRILTPVDAPVGPLPAIVYFHGGGFVIGSPESHDVTCRLLANTAGARLFSVDYRLAPENKFPAAVEDCLAATEWVAANARDLGIDPSRLVVAGDSAGGNLAAVVAQISRDRAGRPPVAFQILIYPVTDASGETDSKRELAAGYMLDRETIDWFHECYASDPADWADPRLSPLRAEDFSKLAPAYVVTAGYDPLRDEGAAYAEAMRLAGVEVTHVDYEGMIHGFFNMTGVIDESRAAIEAAAAAMRRAIG